MSKTTNEPVIPFLTGVLDTSGEGVAAISTQMQRLVDYNDENAPAPNTIALPENAVTANDALGLSDANVTDPNEDTVAGESLADDFKDPNETLENPSATDVQHADVVGTSDANTRGEEAAKKTSSRTKK